VLQNRTTAIREQTEAIRQRQCHPYEQLLEKTARQIPLSTTFTLSIKLILPLKLECRADSDSISWLCNSGGCSDIVDQFGHRATRTVLVPSKEPTDFIIKCSINGYGDPPVGHKTRYEFLTDNYPELAAD
jgi:hypothetical protein